MNCGNKRKNKLKEDFMCRNYKCSVVRFILISVIILAGFTSPVYAKIKSSAAYDETNTGKVTQYSATASGSAVREIKSDGDNEYEVTEDGTPLAGFNANSAKTSPSSSIIPDGWYYSVGAILILVATFAKRKMEVEH